KDVGEQKGPAEGGGPTRHVGVEDDLGRQPAQGADDEEPGLKVVGGVEEELQLFERRDGGRKHDLPEPFADVVRVPFRPADPLPRQPRESADAFGRRLGPWRVGDLVAARIKLESELPVLGDAGSPADLAEKVRADNVSGTGNVS